MAIEISDAVETLKIVRGTLVSYISKSGGTKVEIVDADNLCITDAQGTKYKIPYVGVTSPSSSDLADLASQVENMLGSASDTNLGAIKTNTDKGTSSATTSVASNLASVELLALNTARKKAVIVNDGSNTLYVKEGTAASATSYAYKLSPGDSVIIDDYTGIIHGIWDVATGSARITETV